MILILMELSIPIAFIGLIYLKAYDSVFLLLGIMGTLYAVLGGLDKGYLETSHKIKDSLSEIEGNIDKIKDNTDEIKSSIN